jgi:hypothetical protein
MTVDFRAGKPSSYWANFVANVCKRLAVTGAKMTRIYSLNLLTVMFLAAVPALAFDANKLGQGGSLPLNDLDELIGQSAAFKKEVATALADAKKKADEVICSGNRFPREWVNLSGMRAVPIPANFQANGSTSKPP